MPAATPPSTGGAVRKTVTVLFADVVGSTAFAEHVDAESAREVMGRYHTMARGVVEANGGTITKFIGDGVMAMFGVPEVAEDDASRAVVCGVELQRRFTPIADHVGGRYSAEIGLRVGVNTGEVVIAVDDDDVVGDALNTAARIEAACAPGRVLVGEDTWRLTRARIGYEVLDEVLVKGKAEPVATFQVVDTPSPEEEEEEEEDGSTPFVGRDDELRLLRDTFDQAVADRSVRLATVIGAPGVGKTRLASELLCSVVDHATTATLRCERAGTATFAPIRDLLAGLIGVPLDAEPEAKLAALDVLLDPDPPDRERLVDLLGTFIGAGEARSTEESFFAIRRLLEVLGSVRPVVIVLDDIQWAEPLLLDLLEYLAEWVEGSPVVIVGLARPEIRSRRPSLAEGGRRIAVAVSLGGLDAERTHLLAARLLGVAELPAELVARLPESTEGNPLFVRELVRMLAEDGVLTRDGDSSALTIDVDAVEVPPTIQSLLAARVERLPAAERRLVELASVVGTDVPLGALTALAPDLSRATIDRLVEQLRRKELLEPTGAYWSDEPILRFHHVLIRDAANRRLLKGLRADLHLKIARWTEAASAKPSSESDLTVAFHLEQACLNRRELGVVDEETAGLAARAAGMLRVAAERALDHDDLTSAGSLARRSLDLVGPGHRSRPEVLLLACEANLGSGDIAAGRATLAELRNEGGGDRLAAWADCFDAQLTIFTEPGRLSTAADRCGRAATRLAELGDEAGVAKARQVRAGALARLGRIGECEAELDLALVAARTAGDRRRITAVLGAAPLAALWGPSPVPRAGGRCLDVVRLLRITAGSPAVEATSVRCQAVLEALRLRFGAARELLATARSTAEELGLRHSLLETALYAGLVEILAGDGEAAEPHLRDAHAGLDTLGLGADAGQAAAYLARALLMQGRIEEARPLADEAAEVAGQNFQTAIAADAIRAELLGASGHHGEAIAAANEAVATAARTDLTIEHAAANGALARVLRAAGDTDRARAADREAARLSEAKGAVLVGAPAENGSGATERAMARPAPTSPGPGSGEGSSAITNRAARTTERGIALVNDSDWTRLGDLIATDMRREDRRSGLAVTADRAGFLRGTRALRDLGGTQGGIRHLAVRGDRLSLSAFDVIYEDRARLPVLLLNQLDQDGLVTGNVLFDPDQLVGAVAELDRLHLTTEGASLDRLLGPLAGYLAALNRDDRSAMAGFVDDDTTVVDHRTASIGVVSGPEYDALLGQLHDEHAGGLRSLISRIDGASGRWLLIGFDRYQPTDELGSPTWRLHVLLEIGDHKMRRAELFPEDQFDAARAAFERATTDHSTDLGNRAMRVMDELLSRIAPDDMSVYDELVAEDIVREDRRSAVADAVITGRANLKQMATTMHEVGLRVMPAQWLAVRGEHLAVGLGGYESPSGDQLPLLVVTRINDRDQIDRMLFFDPDDLALATAALHDEWASELTAVEAAHVGLVQEGHTAAVADDADRGVRERPTIQGSGQFLVSRFHELDGGVLTFDYLITARTASGFEHHQTGIAVVRIADDRALEGHHFGADQLAEARELADRLRQDHTTRADGTLRNLATITWTERIDEAARRRDWTTVDDLFADDLVFEMHRRTGSTPDGGKAELVAARGSFQAVGMEVGYQPLAILGDHLALLEVTASDTDGNEVVAAAVIEVDHDGLTVYYGAWDLGDLDEARATLDARWAARSDPPRRLEDNTAARVLRSLCASISREDTSATESLVAVDVVRVDRRPAVSDDEIVGRDLMMDRQRAVFDLGLRLDSVEAIALRGDRLALSYGGFSSTAGDRIPILAVARTDGEERLDRLVFFDPDDLVGAVAELDRLHIDGQDESIASVLRCLSGALAGVNADPGSADWDAFTTDGYVTVDHRPTSIGTIDSDEQRRQLQVLGELQPGLRSLVSTIHRVDEHGLLFTFDRFTPDDPLTEPSWRVHHVGTMVDGRFERLDLFAEQAFDEAMAAYRQIRRGEDLGAGSPE